MKTPVSFGFASAERKYISVNKRARSEGHTDVFSNARVEVTQKPIAIFIKKNILGFDVHVENVPRVKVVDSPTKFPKSAFEKFRKHGSHLLQIADKRGHHK
jgi:hypothetical protein